MANQGKWNAPSSIVTVLASELDNLGNNTISSASAAIANQTNLDIYTDWELNLASLSPAAGAYVAVYIALAIDGTNYPSAGAAMRLQTSQWLFRMQLDIAATTAQRLTARRIIIPPGSFKISLDNQAGVAFGATNTLKMYTYNMNLNG